MNLREIITVHQRLEVRKEEHPHFYYTSVQDVKEDHFAIGVPTARRIPLKAEKGEKLFVVAYAPDARYLFETEVLGKKEEAIPLYLLAWPQSFRREQARQYVRVKTVREVLYRPLEEGETLCFPNLQAEKKALSLNISGGGMQLLVRQQLPSGTLLFLDFFLPFKDSEREFRLLAQVRYCNPAEIGGRRFYVVGVSFEEITESERELIIRYVFREMVRQRRQTED